MTRTPRKRNDRLRTVIKACGWSYDACAAAVRVVAEENGDDLSACKRSLVAYWVAGVQPSGLTPRYLAEAASRRLGYLIKPTDLGFPAVDTVDIESDDGDWWTQDAVADLVTTGAADLERRELAVKALYSLAALAMPLDTWQEIAERGQRAQRGGASVGRAEIETVRDMVAVFSAADERFGGGHARLAVVQYLISDVTAYLRGTFASEADRKAMYSAAAELTYLAGWKSFDSAHHGSAQRYYIHAFRLAGEAGDRALASFTLRAMAHQAIDLGHAQEGLQLADAALSWSHGRATPAATALFTILTARGYAATRDITRTTAAITKAESLLSDAEPDGEPGWIQTSGFTESSLASQAGQALRDLGDLPGAESQLRRSIATRDGEAHRRIHALTLANLADVQCAQGRLGQASANWGLALDHMNGVKSDRARKAVQNIRYRLCSLGARLPEFARRLDQRAADLLRSTR